MKITTSITNKIEAACYSYRRQIDAYIVDCLQELGFKGDPHNLDDVKRYLRWKDIEITIEEWPCMGPNIMHLLTIECKRENYLKKEIFKFQIEVK